VPDGGDAMNGAECLVRTLLAGGVRACFTNPGTSELHIVSALDHTPELRCVLALFEGVATGAADGYARMAGEPACTLLHLGPGLANGLANLHNANRAHVPVINLVGQHPQYHLRYDAPLTSDIEAIARPFSKWVRTSQSSAEVGKDAAEAIVAARTAPGRIATLIVPADVAWSVGGSIGRVAATPRAPSPSPDTVHRASQMLRSKQPTAILLGGSGLYGNGLRTAGRIAAATRAKLLAPYPFTRLERGLGIPPVERVAYVMEKAVDQLKQFRQIILVGAKAPVSYFAYQGKSSEFTDPECELHTLAAETDDCEAALAALADDLGASRIEPQTENSASAQAPTGPITLEGLAAGIAATLPEGAIVADESMTSGRGILAATRRCAPHDWLACTGGSIGIAMPLAVGAAVASRDRRVLCLTADGSGMYTAQALWTMAREALNICTVVFANRVYGVLKREFSNLNVGEPGPGARALFDIGRPDIDWVSLARSMGVPGKRVGTVDDFVTVLHDGFKGEGPTLVEVPL
jgi:acetolactate synthase I/II/III large subunit